MIIITLTVIKYGLVGELDGTIGNRRGRSKNEINLGKGEIGRFPGAGLDPARSGIKLVPNPDPGFVSGVKNKNALRS